MYRTEDSAVFTEETRSFLNDDAGKNGKKAIFKFDESKIYPKSQVIRHNEQVPMVNLKSTPKFVQKQHKNSQQFDFQQAKPPTPKIATQDSGIESQRSQRKNGKVTKEFAIKRFVHRFFQVIDTIKKCHGKHDKDLRKFLTPMDNFLHGLMRLGIQDPDGFTLSETKNVSRHDGLTQLIHQLREHCEVRAKSVYSNKKGQHKITEAPEGINLKDVEKFHYEHTVNMLLLDQFLNDIMKIVGKLKPDKIFYTDID